MRTPWSLVPRHLRTHWVRSGLTVAALVLALFLFCTVRSVVTTLDSAVTSAANNRLFVQSAVSLYVDMPVDYRDKIAQVDGVQSVTYFQWFGGYYEDEKNFFAQFAVDHHVFFDMYRKDIRIVEGPGGVTGEAAWDAAVKAMDSDRRACLVGTGLVREFGWKVGQTIPIVPKIFVKSDGSSWDMNIVGVYEPTKSNVDDRTIWFRWDYLFETMTAEGRGFDGTGAYAVNMEPGADAARVIADIDALFANGPQRTKTTTEAAFQATFVAMMGNVPVFMGTIGGAIVFAVLFSVVNTMLMAARQREHETGILKALGFRDGVLVRLVLVESLVLSGLGGGLGLLLAKISEEGLRHVFGVMLPGYAVEWRTLGLGALLTLAVGVVSAVAPALTLARLRPVDALRSEG
ncbi:MAG: ABC transporter permease [Planctomycetes bacterium]|nr:ABC transporter permease [Planctomycetota bacterium]